jgi:hypothetical protein
MTPALHDAITTALAAGELQKDIAKRLGIKKDSVSRVARGQPRIDGRSTWRERRTNTKRPKQPIKLNPTPKPPPSRGRGGSFHRHPTYDDKASAGTFKVVNAEGKVLGSSTREWEAEQLARQLGARVVRRGES